MQPECVLCGTAFDQVARAPMRTTFTRSGTLPSTKSWCAACDGPNAAGRARRELARRRAHLEADRRRAYMAEYNRRPEVLAKKRDAKAAARFRTRKSFRCAECLGRFAGNREARRQIEGRVVRVGMCAFCAEQRYGAPVTGPKIGWAAYQRAWRARQRAMRGKAQSA